MPEAPPVQVVDPDNARRPVDVLDGGEPRAPRVARRWKVVALGVAVLGAAGVVAGRSIPQDRAEQEARDAAFALSDRVHLHGRLGAVYGVFEGADRVLSAEVQVASADGQRGGDRVTGLRFEGTGLTPRAPDPSGLAELPVTVWPASDLDCEAVAAGRYPGAVSVVLDVVPRSGVTHSQRMPVQAAVLREASLQGCDLPDPDALTRVEAQGAADGTLLVYLEPVQRSRQPLVLEAVRVPGFDVRPVHGLTLPASLPPGTSGLFGFTVRVTECATAGGSEASVRLQVGDASQTRVAGTEVSQPQPGGVPAAQLLQGLLDVAC